jgi:ribosome biogenesis protein SSF1/2
VNNNRVPDMSKFNDLADFIMHSRNKANAGFSSESEADDLPESRIVLPEDYQDKKGGSSVALKLHELGPRMKWQLVKIEEGFCRGNVVFHAH